MPPQMPSALLRSVPSANMFMTIDRAAGNTIAAPSPWMPRITIRNASLVDSAQARDAAGTTAPALRHVPKFRLAVYETAEPRPRHARHNDMTGQRRWFAGAALGVVAGLGLAGCTGGPTASGTSAVPAGSMSLVAFRSC